MLITLTYLLYLIILLVYILYNGLNYFKYQCKKTFHPKAILYLLPFISNYFAQKYIFYSLNPFFTLLLPSLLIYFIGNKLQNVRIFGLTGGIACGKSTLVKDMSDHLQQELLIIDCDKLTRELSQKGSPGYKLILKLLGSKKDQFLLQPSLEIDRENFSNFVFNNPDFRKTLTRQMGKKILWKIFSLIIGSIFDKKKLLMIDAPTLYETKFLEYICFPIIVVGCPKQIQIQRLVQTRGMKEQKANAIINSQLPLEYKKKRADIYIQNVGTPEQMFTEALKKLNKLMKKK